MLTFADNFIQKRLFRVPQKRALLLYFWHTFFCVFYFWYSLNNTSDSTLYYLISHSYDRGFKFGTSAIYYFVSFFTQGLNLSYGNVFLIFNIFGYIGLLALASALQSIVINSHHIVKKLSVLFLFLPGMSFWSSAIGKDAITFMAAGLTTWAAINLSRRWPAIAISALLFLVPRPHMAAILLLCFCIALLLSSRIGTFKKMMFLAIALPLSAVGVQFGLLYAGLDDVSDVQTYVEDRQNHNLGGGSSVDIAGMSVPMRMFTYLFRPLFFDGLGALHVVVSIENLMLLILFLATSLKSKINCIPFTRFEVIFYSAFTVVCWVVLANTTANLGIAIRQKTMFLPILISLLFLLLKYVEWPHSRRN